MDVELEIDDWGVAVCIDGENTEERLEEHGAQDHIAALGLVWVEILSVDLAVLESSIICVVISEGGKRDIYVV